MRVYPLSSNSHRYTTASANTPLFVGIESDHSPSTASNNWDMELAFANGMVLRLRYEAQLSLRQIALCLSLSIGVISKYLKRADGAGIGWPSPEGMSNEALERKRKITDRLYN